MERTGQEASLYGRTRVRFTALFVAGLLMVATAYAAPFTDVPRDHWAYDAIQRAVDAGILQGFDGKFHGKKLLNRYQMAVVVAKMLDQVKGGVSMGSGAGGQDIQNLEALTIEFADELALLNVKVSTLEDSFVELRNDVQALKGGRPMASSGGGSENIPLKGFTAFSLVNRDEEGGLAPYGNNLDDMFFTSPLVALAFQKDVGEGIVFNARLNYQTDVGNTTTAADNSATVDNAYFQMDQIFGDTIGGRAGGFDLGFLSMEHNGAFQTCDYTITPSALNMSLRAYHVYGLDLKKMKDVQPGDTQIALGILSGTDTAPAILQDPAGLHHEGGEVTGALEDADEEDGSFGFYLFVKKPRGEAKFGWNFAYFSNGGDSEDATEAADEADFMQIGLDVAQGDLSIILQYMDGSYTAEGFAASTEVDVTDFFLLLNYKIDEKQSLSLRYEDYERDLGAATAEASWITLAFNRKVSDTSMFQFEYLSPDSDDISTGVGGDADDTLMQFRYKVWF
mgnify:FL=1